jgi:hypothetical protein
MAATTTKQKQKRKSFTVTYLETRRVTKQGHVLATDRMDAFDAAQDKYAYDYRDDGMGGSYAVEIVTVEEEG